MLKKLRLNLTLIYTIVTGAILAIMGFGIVFIYENQLHERSDVSFKSNINSIVYNLQSGQVIEDTWLAQLEAGNRLIIYIEDNNLPIMFKGSWDTVTNRDKLISKVQNTALNEYGFNIKIRPNSSIEVKTIIFNITGDNNERYQASATKIPFGRGWYNLIVLRDMRDEDSYIVMQRFLFTFIVVFGMIILFISSWILAGNAIRPVRISTQRQIEFVQAASHELRSPLAVIQTSASVLEIQSVNPDPILFKKFSKTIKRECIRMGRLVDDLLLLASADAKTWSIQTEVMEIETLLTDCYENYEELARKKNQNLFINLPDDALPIIVGDKQRIQQALSVIIDNALFYTQNGGKISLRAFVSSKNIRIEIADNGPGISDENKRRVFERFYRIDLSRNKKEHYGLGLSVAFEIISLHKGKIFVMDTDGGGSTFILLLPVKE